MVTSLLIDVGSGALGFALLTTLIGLLMVGQAAQERSETRLLAAARSVRATFGLMALSLREERRCCRRPAPRSWSL